MSGPRPHHVDASHEARSAADGLDTHRKRVLDRSPDLTMTGIYNVLEKVRNFQGDFTDEERRILRDGEVYKLRELHDRLDKAVADAYGWPADLSDDEIMRRLVALNLQRHEEEQRGLVRWLRPDYQIPRFGKSAAAQASQPSLFDTFTPATPKPEPTKPRKLFPATAVERTAAIFDAIKALSEDNFTASTIAAQFQRSGAIERHVAPILQALARLGHINGDTAGFVRRP